MPRSTPTHHSALLAVPADVPAAAEAGVKATAAAVASLASTQAAPARRASPRAQVKNQAQSMEQAVAAAPRAPRQRNAATHSTADAPEAAPLPSATPLTRDTVLAAALALIDLHGVEGFSVRDLARTLNVYPTALYWHVPGRNALIAGAVAQALGEMPLPDPQGDWRQELRQLLARYRSAVQRHPRIAPVLGAQLVSNEGMDVQLVDRLLALLEGAGFEGAALASAYNVVIAAMVGFVTLELAPRPADDPQGWATQHAHRLHHLDKNQAPTLARHLPHLADRAFVVRWSSGSDKPMDAGFAAWCKVIVHGLEALRPNFKPNHPDVQVD